MLRAAKWTSLATRPSYAWVVPGARHGPNVCRFVSSGWPRHESETNLSGLDLGTFGRRLALGGCRIARLAGTEDWHECLYGGDQAN